MVEEIKDSSFDHSSQSYYVILRRALGQSGEPFGNISQFFFVLLFEDFKQLIFSYRKTVTAFIG